jgi:hypothetical protein
MPSPLLGGKFYKRKGGAYKKRGHVYTHVGSGNGNYSKRNIEQDRKRKATHKGRKLVKRYPQEYD